MGIKMRMGTHRSVFSGILRKEGGEQEAKKSGYTACAWSIVVLLERGAFPGRSRNASD